MFTLWSTNLTPIAREDSSFESGPNVVKLVPEPNKAGQWACHGGVGLLAVSKMNPSTQNKKEYIKKKPCHACISVWMTSYRACKTTAMLIYDESKRAEQNATIMIMMSKSNLATGRWEWQLAAMVLMICSKLTSLCLYSTILLILYKSARCWIGRQVFPCWNKENTK